MRETVIYLRKADDKGNIKIILTEGSTNTEHDTDAQDILWLLTHVLPKSTYEQFKVRMASYERLRDPDNIDLPLDRL